MRLSFTWNSESKKSTWTSLPRESRETYNNFFAIMGTRRTSEKRSISQPWKVKEPVWLICSLLPSSMTMSSLPSYGACSERLLKSDVMWWEAPESRIQSACIKAEAAMWADGKEWGQRWWRMRWLRHRCICKSGTMFHRVPRDTTKLALAEVGLRAGSRRRSTRTKRMWLIGERRLRATLWVRTCYATRLRRRTWIRISSIKGGGGMAGESSRRRGKLRLRGEEFLMELVEGNDTVRSLICMG